MATRGTPVTGAWTEVTAPLVMVDGTSYAVEVQGSDGTIVLAHDSESSSAPDADADGHSLYPRSQRPEGDLLRFTKRSGWYWYMRTRNGAGCRLIVTEAG